MAIKQLDLNLLPIAVALYDELSVSRAARRLGVSQPAVSRALRRLRDAFEDPLFVRRPSGIAPTPRAHALVRAVRPNLDRLQHDLVSDEHFDPATSTRPISLAISDVAELAFFPSVIEHFASTRRSARYGQSRSPSRSSPADWRAETWTWPRILPALAARNFRHRRLSKHGFACLMRAGHPLWKHRLTLSAYLSAEHIVIRSEGRSQELLERFIERRRMRRKAAVYTSHVLSVPFIVMESDLLATLPYAVATRFASLTSDVLAACLPSTSRTT